MDIANLVPVVHQLFASGLADSTRKVYRSGEERYLRFCESAGLSPFPTAENVLLLFVSSLHQHDLAHSTVKSYLAAIRHGQISRGMGNPNIHTFPQLEYVLKGVKKATPASARRRLPITPHILVKLREAWRATIAGQDARMLWAASCLCFFGFLRSGEVVCPPRKAMTQNGISA